MPLSLCAFLSLFLPSVSSPISVSLFLSAFPASSFCLPPFLSLCLSLFVFFLPLGAVSQIYYITLVIFTHVVCLCFYVIFICFHTKIIHFIWVAMHSTFRLHCCGILDFMQGFKPASSSLTFCLLLVSYSYHLTWHLLLHQEDGKAYLVT